MYDNSKIGKKVGSGHDQVVYMYGDDHVIKFSRTALLVGNRVKKKLQHDYQICKQYFGEFIVEVEDVSQPNSRRYIEVQEYVRGTPMCPHHAFNPNLVSQLKEILKCQKQLLSAGHAPLDLVGNGGLFRSCLSNVLVDSNDRLRIIDALLAEAKTVSSGAALLVFPLKAYGMWRQRKNIEKIFAVAECGENSDRPKSVRQ